MIFINLRGCFSLFCEGSLSIDSVRAIKIPDTIVLI